MRYAYVLSVVLLIHNIICWNQSFYKFIYYNVKWIRCESMYYYTCVYKMENLIFIHFKIPVSLFEYYSYVIIRRYFYVIVR